MSYEAEFKRFLRKRSARGLSEKTLADDKSCIDMFLNFVGDKEITPDLVLEFSEFLKAHTFTKGGKQHKYSKYSIYQIETKVKLFLSSIDKNLCEDLNSRLPKTRKLPEDILNEKDVEALLSACQSLRDKALVAFLFESGVRKGELFSIRIKDVVFDSNGAVITIPAGKTGSRRIRVVYCSIFLRQYIESHPCTDTSSYLFCSTRKPYGRLSDSGLKEQLKEISKRAKLDKNIFPHLFRHSAATRLAKHLSEQSLKTYLGWTAGSTMAATYVHLTGKDIDPEILKMNGIEVTETTDKGMRVRLCPRCREINPETSTYCGKCGMPLHQEAFTLEEKEEVDFEKLFMLYVKEHPEILNTYLSDKN